MKLGPRQLQRLMWLWPPYLGAGVRVRHFSPDGSRVAVEHRPNLLTKNAFGTVFGGTMMTMTDPFFMLMAVARLGPDYRVWDVGAQIEFVKQARGPVRSEMRITEADYDLIVARTATGEKFVHEFSTEITDESGDAVALVRRRVYFRRTLRRPATASGTRAGA